MHALLCDACRYPLGAEGYDVTLLRGTVVQTPGEYGRLSTTGGGVFAATLCERCGERISAILRRKLQDPCPTCEIEPMRAADRRHAEELAFDERRQAAG